MAMRLNLPPSKNWVVYIYFINFYLERASTSITLSLSLSLLSALCSSPCLYPPPRIIPTHAASLPRLCYVRVSSCIWHFTKGDELNLIDQRCICVDDGRVPNVAVRQPRRDRELRDLPRAHQRNAFVPSRNDLAAS